jgi:hypothetical protein
MYIQIPQKMESQIIFKNIQAQKKTNETHLTKYKDLSVEETGGPVYILFTLYFSLSNSTFGMLTMTFTDV